MCERTSRGREGIWEWGRESDPLASSMTGEMDAQATSREMLAGLLTRLRDPSRRE